MSSTAPKQTAPERATGGHRGVSVGENTGRLTGALTVGATLW
jgi:hypothetical protein